MPGLSIVTRSFFRTYQQGKIYRSIWTATLSNLLCEALRHTYENGCNPDQNTSPVGARIQPEHTHTRTTSIDDHDETATGGLRHAFPTPLTCAPSLRGLVWPTLPFLRYWSVYWLLLLGLCPRVAPLAHASQPATAAGCTAGARASHIPSKLETHTRKALGSFRMQLFFVPSRSLSAAHQH